MAAVNIKGTIVSNDEQWIYDWLNIDAASPKKVADEIKQAKGGSLEVFINSGGGDVFAGSEIYTTLKAYPGDVLVKIIGLAASAASVIAMAGKNILMSPTSQLMIHNVSSGSRGDYKSMEHMAMVLKNADRTIANAYRIKTGKSEEELIMLMDNETWFTPQQALTHGFIDGIMFDNQYNKTQTQIQLDSLKSKGNSQTDALRKAQAELNLLILKGEKQHEHNY